MSLSSISDRKSKIRRGDPITICDLTFYPITMSDYEQFVECKNAWILRLGTLPVKYQMQNFLSAIYTLELDTIQSHGAKTGLFEKVIRFLYLSLRIGVNTIAETLAVTEKDVNGHKELDELFIMIDKKTVRISAIDFSTKIRPLLAEMNGLLLPDETENIDLVRDSEELQAMKAGPPLHYDINDLISSVAYQSRVSEREINAWTVREFEARRRAIDRDKRYMMYGQADLGGMVTFKKGNPAPSWCFDREEDIYDNDALKNLGQAFGQN